MAERDRAAALKREAEMVGASGAEAVAPQRRKNAVRRFLSPSADFAEELVVGAADALDRIPGAKSRTLENAIRIGAAFPGEVSRALPQGSAVVRWLAEKAVPAIESARNWVNSEEAPPQPATVPPGAPAATAVPVGQAPAGPYVPKGVTPEGRQAGMKVSGQNGPAGDGVTSGASSTAFPDTSSRADDLRSRFGFSFSSPGHVVSDAERAGTMFADGRKTEFAMGGPVQFNEDDARRPGQLAQQAYDRDQEELAMKRRTADLLHAKQLADAQAMMGFTAKYGVPYDPETAKYVSEAERQMAEDDDFDAVVDALDAKRIQGYFMDPDDYASYASMSPEQQAEARAKSDRNYQKAMQEASLNWGVRRGGVDLKSLKPEQALDSLLGQ